MTSGWVVEAIRSLKPQVISQSGLKRSAVAMLLRPTGPGPTDFDVVFTRRADDLSNHASQVSFPGGRMEAGETPAQTALRETQEELGITTGGITILGQLDPMVTNSGFHVTPIAALLEGDVVYRPDSREVARVFHVPLVALLRRESWEVHEHQYKSKSIPIWYFHYDGEVIWGVTGYILHHFLEYLWESLPAL